MGVRRLNDGEAGALQQHLWFPRHALAMLQAACGMIGHREAGCFTRGSIADTCEELADVACERRDLLGLAAPWLRFGTEHEAVVLHRGAATGGVDDDSIQVFTFGQSGPCGDIGARTCHSRYVLPHVVRQGTAA